jgi:hypothetical protein
VPHTIGKLSTRDTILLQLNWRSTQKVWAPKVIRVPTLGISGLPFGKPGTKWHLGAGFMARHKVYYKGEGGGFPQVRAMVSFVSSCLARGSSVHQKCSSYTLINLLFGLCRYVWVVELLVNLPNPDPRALAHPSNPEVLRAKERAPTFFVLLFSLLDSQLSPSRSLGVCQLDLGILNLD